MHLVFSFTFSLQRLCSAVADEADFLMNQTATDVPTEIVIMTLQTRPFLTPRLGARPSPERRMYSYHLPEYYYYYERIVLELI